MPLILISKCADCIHLYENSDDNFHYYCKKLKGLTSSNVHRYVVNSEKPYIPECCPMFFVIEEYMWALNKEKE